ncbi:hypothetical protein M422DRAFT_269196 [Sphaerobolus stellatus SS14]|uniref:Uncharacterized protein n=1 Tax=Sphaerobolus stellatus (strain SS14) TaxID=990650 RepID=A0A0C9TIQ7_SPHS4|nr:hypothetical protein M422DRAFT_269196 [Sphaerobolus stellatus SS14]
MSLKCHKQPEVMYSIINNELPTDWDFICLQELPLNIDKHSGFHTGVDQVGVGPVGQSSGEELMVDRDLMEADSKVLTLMDMKSRGVEIPPALEKRILANRSSIIASYTTHMEYIFTWMNLIQKHTAWTKNELPDSVLGFGNQEAGPSDHAEDAGNKRKAEEDGDHAEGSDNKKRGLKEEEDSTMH